jgi:hypothetical protein
MIEQEEFAARVVESSQSVISVVNAAVVGHARHATDLVSRTSDPNNDIDPVQELARFSKRTIRDGARLFAAMWAMVEALAQDSKGPITAKPESPPNPNPVKATVGPVAIRGRCQSEGLRRRGETTTTIAATQITVTRNPVDPSQLDVVIEAGGAPRGLYEGAMKVGSGAAMRGTPYNVYVDWK